MNPHEEFCHWLAGYLSASTYENKITLHDDDISKIECRLHMLLLKKLVIPAQPKVLPPYADMEDMMRSQDPDSIYYP